MSGIYIPNMEMPKSCWDCDLSAEDVCLASGFSIDRTHNSDRAYTCPLVPVPDHGRLIDADALDIYRREDMQFLNGRNMKETAMVEADAYTFEVPLVGKFLNNRKKGNDKITGVLDVSVPTIIPADRKDCAK